MKKLLFIVMLIIAGVTQLKANDTIVDVTQCYNGMHNYICINKYERMLISIPETCIGYWIRVNDELQSDNPVILNGSETSFFIVEFYGCDMHIEFYINFIEPEIPKIQHGLI